MGVTRAIKFEPNNESHNKMLEEFLNEKKDYIDLLTQIKKAKTNNEQNNIDQYIIIELDQEIRDIFHIKGEKDTKICTISCPIQKDEKTNKRNINIASNYALNTLNMEEVFIKILPQQEAIRKYLLNNNYEYLGYGDSNEIIFLKEKEINQIKSYLVN